MEPIVDSSAPLLGSIRIKVLVEGCGGGGNVMGPKVEPKNAPLGSKAIPVSRATLSGCPTTVTSPLDWSMVTKAPSLVELEPGPCPPSPPYITTTGPALSIEVHSAKTAV